MPFELSRRYVERAKELGDDAELIALADSDHFQLVKPGTKEFERVSEVVLSLMGA